MDRFPTIQETQTFIPTAFEEILPLLHRPGLATFSLLIASLSSPSDLLSGPLFIIFPFGTDRNFILAFSSYRWAWTE